MTDHIEESSKSDSENSAEATGIGRRQFLTGGAAAAAVLGMGLASGAATT